MTKAETTPPDEPTLRELAAQGMGDTEIGQRYGVHGRTVRRWRAQWGIPAGAAPGRKRTSPPRDAVLYVELTTDERIAADRHAREAGHATTAPWVRRLVVELPELVRQGDLEAVAAIVLGSADPG